MVSLVRRKGKQLRAHRNLQQPVPKSSEHFETGYALAVFLDLVGGPIRKISITSSVYIL